MTDYTKGPWSITTHGTLIQKGGNENRPIEVAGINIAHFSRYEAPRHQIANAHLIKAAPELYELLEEALEYLAQNGKWDESHDIFVRGNEVLRNARPPNQSDNKL